MDSSYCTPSATSTSSRPRRRSVSANSYPSFLSSTRSHTSAYASAMRPSAVRWMTSAERGFASSARRGDVRGSCEVRKDENFVSAAVSSVAVAPGRRESGVCCQLAHTSRSSHLVAGCGSRA